MFNIIFNWKYLESNQNLLIKFKGSPSLWVELYSLKVGVKIDDTWIYSITFHLILSIHPSDLEEVV